MGEPGAGKTALSSWLINNRKEITAFHLCNATSKEKRDPIKLILSIAYQLSTQIPAYHDKLVNLDLDYILNEYDNVNSLFDVLITQPLFTIQHTESDVVILIDALDETSHNGQNELALFIASEFEKTPSWLRMVITSRPNAEVISPLQKYNPTCIDTSSVDNMNDVTLYVRRYCENLDVSDEEVKNMVAEICKKSEGNFLYAKYVIKAISESMDKWDTIRSLPHGISGIYTNFFTRQFPDINFYRQNIRPILSVVLSAIDPIDTELLEHVTGVSEEDINDCFMTAGSLFANVDNKITPYHNTLKEWLLNKDQSFNYFISQKSGVSKWAHATISYFRQRRQRIQYFNQYGCFHLCDSDNLEEVVEFSGNKKFQKGMLEVFKEALRENNRYKEALLEIIQIAFEEEAYNLIEVLIEEIEKSISLGYTNRSIVYIDAISDNDEDGRFEYYINYLHGLLNLKNGTLVKAKDIFERLINDQNHAMYYRALFNYTFTIKELGNYIEAENRYKQLYNYSNATDDDNKILYTTQYADILYVKGRHKEALGILNATLEIQNIDSFRLDDIADVYRIIGHIYRMNEQYENAEKYYLLALEKFERSGSISGIARIKTNLAETYAVINPAKALEYGISAVELNNRLSIPVETGKAYNAMGLAELFLGNKDMAIEYLNKAADIFDNVGYQSGLGMVYTNRLIVYLKERNRTLSSETLLQLNNLFDQLESYPSLIIRSQMLYDYIYSESINAETEYMNKVDWIIDLDSIKTALNRNIVSKI